MESDQHVYRVEQLSARRSTIIHTYIEFEGSERKKERVELQSDIPSRKIRSKRIRKLAEGTPSMTFQIYSKEDCNLFT